MWPDDKLQELSISPPLIFLDRRLQEYWDWSWDDLVVKDMPNMIDYVCTHTGQKPHFVGHSMVRKEARDQLASV